MFSDDYPPESEGEQTNRLLMYILVTFMSGGVLLLPYAIADFIGRPYRRRNYRRQKAAAENAQLKQVMVWHRLHAKECVAELNWYKKHSPDDWHREDELEMWKRAAEEY